MAIEHAIISPTYIYKNEDRKVVTIYILLYFIIKMKKKKIARHRKCMGSGHAARTRPFKKIGKESFKTRVYEHCDKDRESSLLFLFSVFKFYLVCVFQFGVFLLCTYVYQLA